MNNVFTTIRFLPILLFFLLMILVPSAHAQEAPPSADLKVSLLASLPLTSDNYQYFIAFTNQGPDMASNVAITLSVPEGTQAYVTHIISPTGGGCSLTEENTVTCLFSLLPSGSGGRIDVNIYHIEGRSRSLPATAVIEGNTYDPDYANNASSAVVLFVDNGNKITQLETNNLENMKTFEQLQGQLVLREQSYLNRSHSLRKNCHSSHSLPSKNIQTPV